MSAFLKALGTASERLEMAARLRAEDQQKALMGQFVLEQMRASGLPPCLLTYNNIKFSDWLNEDGRKAFGLTS